jgi:glycosyltransferase involved in cell wall biosynthesis
MNQIRRDVKISAVIITFNEEAHLARCIKSLTDLVDEIIVLDSISTDDTVHIAESFGAKVVHQPFLGYTEQKNAAIGHASHDWILSLDADEALDIDLKNALLAVKSDPIFMGYEMTRLNFYCGKPIRHGSWNPDIKLRFFNRNHARWEGEKIHEYVALAGEKGRLPGFLLHHTINSIQQYAQQTEKFARLRAEQVANKSSFVLCIKLIFNPIWHFFRSYFLKLGFLDGFAGLTIARWTGYGEWLKYLGALQLKR